MLSRSFALRLVAGSALVLPSLVAADASAAEPWQGASHGALVVALGQGATNAAKPLARDVYRDDDLRPAVDNTLARVLVGEAPSADAPAALRDLAAVRATISASPEDPGARRLLASIGAEAHAELVVVVSVVGERTIARVLHVSPPSYEPIELVPTLERTDGSEARFSWPGVASTLHRYVTPRPAAPSLPASAASSTPPALAPRKAPSAPEGPKEPAKRSIFTSPWFWGPVSAVVLVGAAVLIASKVTAGDPSTVHLSGTVSP